MSTRQEQNAEPLAPTLRTFQAEFESLSSEVIAGAGLCGSATPSATQQLARLSEGLHTRVSTLDAAIKDAKTILHNGKELFTWEYRALQELVRGNGLDLPEVVKRIEVENLSVVKVLLHELEITHISPLAKLPGLRLLSLVGTCIKDVQALSQLINLELLGISFTPVEDVSPISRLPKLRGLWLKVTPVKDLTPLLTLPALEELWLDEGCRNAHEHETVIEKLAKRGVTVFPPPNF